MKPADRDLLLLDRDGVINRLVVDPEHGTIDSPLHPDQVELLPGAAEALAQLSAQGYALVIVSNQPAASQGKTFQTNLEHVHDRIIELAQKAGGRIRKSYLCFHSAADHCACRKPGTALLEQAFADHPDCARESSWMVGDGIFDMEAGMTLGIRTAFLAKHKCDTCQILAGRPLSPTLWADDLLDFARKIVHFH